MRWGMGILLTKDEEKVLAPITKPCFAALGLANDYYSFDIEWKEFQQERAAKENPTMTNAVWLFMNWQGLSIHEAKEKTRQVVRKYEEDFQSQMSRFVEDKTRCSPNMARYLKALAYQIPGNVAWSLRCPRYHPELCPDAAKRLEDSMDKMEQSSDAFSAKEAPARHDSEGYGSEASASSRPSPGSPESEDSSVSSLSSFNHPIEDHSAKREIQLSDQVRFPFQYIMSMWLTRLSICWHRSSIYVLSLPKASAKH